MLHNRQNSITIADVVKEIENLRITKSGRRDLRSAMVDSANAAVRHHPFWKREFERLSPRLGRSKTIVAIAPSC